MGVKYSEFHLQLINARTGNPIDDDSGVVNVLTAGSPVELTIFSDDNGTSESNPLTMTDGVIKFFTAVTTTTCDLSIYTSNGDAYFLKTITRFQHRVVVDVDKMEQTLVIPFDAQTSETDTGFTLAGNVRVKDCRVRVVTADSGITMDVGLDGTTNNDPNGLIAAVSVASTGYVELNPAHTAGSNADYYGATTVGAFLANAHAGEDTGVTTLGGFVPITFMVLSGETDANVTFTGSSGADTMAGYMILTLQKMP